MKDPFEVLNISRTASESEIREAYRELARKYHPDNYQNNPLADLAQEKMAEINEAYDTIMQQRGRGVSGASGGRTGGMYGEIRELIAQDRTDEAQRILEQISPGLRSAEWHFLMGTLLHRRGWLADARMHYQEALRRDPSNPEYQSAAETSAWGRPTGPAGPYATTCCLPVGGGCEFCASMLCANMLCNCCCRP